MEDLQQEVDKLDERSLRSSKNEKPLPFMEIHEFTEIRYATLEDKIPDHVSFNVILKGWILFIGTFKFNSEKTQTGIFVLPREFNDRLFLGALKWKLPNILKDYYFVGYRVENGVKTTLPIFAGEMYRREEEEKTDNE